MINFNNCQSIDNKHLVEERRSGTVVWKPKEGMWGGKIKLGKVFHCIGLHADVNDARKRADDMRDAYVNESVSG